MKIKRMNLFMRAVSFTAVIVSLSLPLSGTEIVAPRGVKLDSASTEFFWQKVQQMDVEERPKIILVLGGGGARGLAHIGVLRVLEQEGIPVDRMVGISVGALVGALYSGGVSVDQLDKMAKKIGWNKLSDLSKVGIMKILLTDELLSTKKMETYLEDHLGKKYFSDLRIPFTCIATDIQTGERVIFNEGEVGIAARASATIPGLFKPVLYRQRSLVDGGLVDALPTDLVTNGSWNVIVGILPKTDYGNYEISSVLSTLVRSIEIQKDVIVEQKKKLADFLIEPDVRNISFLDMAKSEEAINAGELAARANVEDLKRLIIRRVFQRKSKDVGTR